MIHTTVLTTAWKVVSPIINPVLNFFDKGRQRRIQASMEFRSTVLNELKGLYPFPSDWPEGTGIDPTLRKIFPALQIAVEKFRPFVPQKDQEAFEYAWVVYRTATKRDVDQDYTHYQSFGASTYTNSSGWKTTKTQGDGKITFKKNVDRLLSFAKYS